MVDIPLIVGSDSASLDWCDPATLALPIDQLPSSDIETYLLMLLCTDRVIPDNHYGIQPTQRRGSWHDSYVGEFGSLFWVGTEMNLWSGGSKLAQIQRWAEMAVEPVYDEGLIQSPAVITTEFVSDEAVQINIDVIAADGTQRAIVYVLEA